jgi:hypothetical protein
MGVCNNMSYISKDLFKENMSASSITSYETPAKMPVQKNGYDIAPNQSETDNEYKKCDEEEKEKQDNPNPDDEKET